jgi:hypothetical protein
MERVVGGGELERSLNAPPAIVTSPVAPVV